jgi:hypothetical protein
LTLSVEFAYLVRPAYDQSFLARATEEERAVLEQHGEWLEARYTETREPIDPSTGLATASG